MVPTHCRVSEAYSTQVTIKLCAIGRDCKIGAKSKLNNCIVMDGAFIGEKYASSPDPALITITLR